MLLQQLLCGKLAEYSKETLEAELENIPRLHDSSAYWNNLTNILDIFHNRQTHLNGTLHGTLQACEFGKELLQPLYAVLEGILSHSPILSLLPCSSNDSRLVPPATSIREIANLEQSFPTILADLTSDFCVEWLSYSSQGVPL